MTLHTWSISAVVAPLALIGSLGWQHPTASTEPAAASEVRQRSPSLEQLKAKAGCISDSGHRGACHRAAGLRGPSALAVSSSGRHVYVAAGRGGAVVSLQRRRRGALKAIGCVSERRLRGCARGRGLRGAASLALSPDQRHVYVAADRTDSGERGSLAVFARDGRSGRLRQLGCFDTGGDSGCAPAPALEGAQSVVVSPDGRDVYVAGDNILAFRRDPSTGRLAERGCLAGGSEEAATCSTRGLAGERANSGLEIAPDGRELWSSGSDPGVLGDGMFMTALARDPRTGVLSVVGCVASGEVSTPMHGCRVAKGRLDNPTVSPDGRWLYTHGQTGGDGIAVTIFRRGIQSGDLRFAGCLRETDFADTTCARGHVATDDPWDIAFAPSGSLAFTAGWQRSSIAVLRRNPVNGKLSPSRVRRGCVSEDGTAVDRLAFPDARGRIVCSRGRAVDSPVAISVSPDGRYAYVAASGSDAVSVFSVRRSTR